MTLPAIPTSVWGGTGTSVWSGTVLTIIDQSDRWILTLGDSKTAFHDSQYGHWQDALIAGLAVSPGGVWRYVNRGVGSQTVATYLTIMQSGSTLSPTCTAPLSANDSVCLPPQGVPPAAVLFNLGVNDAYLDVVTSEAVWQVNYLAMIDLVRVKWPTAPIYVMRWWARDFDADADTMNGWVPAMIALRNWVYLGPDERVWMKGVDNGVTMTYDGIHQNSVGIAETAAQWQAIFGV